MITSMLIPYEWMCIIITLQHYWSWNSDRMPLSGVILGMRQSSTKPLLQFPIDENVLSRCDLETSTSNFHWRERAFTLSQLTALLCIRQVQTNPESLVRLETMPHNSATTIASVLSVSCAQPWSWWRWLYHDFEASLESWNRNTKE